MASVTGSRLAFFAPVTSPVTPVNVVLTTDGTGIGAPISGSLNIEVFTSTAGSLATGYAASAVVPGAVLLSDGTVQAATIGSTEQILAGSYTVVDHTGSEKIQIVGSGSGGDSITVIGAGGDTITGSSVAGDSQLINASLNGPVVAGPETIQGGAGSTTVWGGPGDSITGGAGSLQVTGHVATGITVVGGAGSLNATDFGTKASVSGSTGGTTYIDTAYAGGGASSIVGGSGSGTLAGGENTQIIAGTGDRVTVGGALTYVDASMGSVTVSSSVNVTGIGTIEGRNNVGVNILGGTGDNIGLIGNTGNEYIDASAGTQTVTGGSGLNTVYGGAGDAIGGGSGNLQVDDLNPATGGAEKITGGSGNLFVFNVGKNVTVTGGTLGTTFVDDSYGSGGGSSITGGTGTATSLFGGLFTANTDIKGAAGDTITGQSGSMYVDAQLGSQTVTGGSGAATVLGGNLDAIVGGSGTLRVDMTAKRSGSEQVTVGSGAALLRDVPNPTGTGAAATTTVTGFNTTLDTIASLTSVLAGGGTGPSALAVGASAVASGANTLISFADGSTMTVLSTTPGAIKFMT